MRAVIDTNVLLSGLLWRGAPRALIEPARAAGTLAMVSSPALLDEVISRAKFDEILARSDTSREGSMVEMQQLAEVIVPPPLPQPVCRDSDDNHVLSCRCALPQSSCCHALFVEETARVWLESLGWSVRHGLEIAPGESEAERFIGRAV